MSLSFFNQYSILIFYGKLLRCILSLLFPFWKILKKMKAVEQRIKKSYFCSRVFLKRVCTYTIPSPQGHIWRQNLDKMCKFIRKLFLISKLNLLSITWKKNIIFHYCYCTLYKFHHSNFTISNYLSINIWTLPLYITLWLGCLGAVLRNWIQRSQ